MKHYQYCVKFAEGSLLAIEKTVRGSTTYTFTGQPNKDTQTALYEKIIALDGRVLTVQGLDITGVTRTMVTPGNSSSIFSQRELNSLLNTS